jgi:histone-lysine N-methyltransferase SETMAR
LLEWKSPLSPRAKKVWQVQSSTKNILIVFFDMKGIVNCEFVPPNTTVTSDFYYDVLRCLRENMQHKRPEPWGNHNQLLHHDNTPTLTSLKTTELETNNNMVFVPYPPYLPDLAPCDFALFPKLKVKLKG